MSTRLRDKKEKLEEIIAELIEEAAKGKLIVVEGKKDAIALQELGIKGNFFTVKTGGKSFLEATAEIEQSGVKEVILLLDNDRRGKEGTKRLQLSLEQARIKVNLRLKRKLWGLVGKEIQCVESLPAYLITLQQKISVA